MQEEGMGVNRMPVLRLRKTEVESYRPLIAYCLISFWDFYVEIVSNPFVLRETVPEDFPCRI